mmetsp:Transcript_2864/g.4918  ORF Transcript_2864/g.4918 Transcript_2864/m.4918 type:complete len:92 (+) Transcript_2864:343-618(+)
MWAVDERPHVVMHSPAYNGIVVSSCLHTLYDCIVLAATIGSAFQLEDVHELTIHTFQCAHHDLGSGVPAGSSINKIQVDQPNNGETKTRLE